MSHRAERAEAAPTGITPDEVFLLKRRQEWRGRILRICVRIVKDLTDDQLSDLSLSGHRDVRSQFVELAERIEANMKRLLESEMGVPVLETHRHAANYFLDTLIRQVRDQEEQRTRSAGRSEGPGPLESLSDETLEVEVRRILRLNPDALPVFVKDLVVIEQFEQEVQEQRRRLQFLLGCDRALRDLAESNAEIIEAEPTEFARIVKRFTSYCRAIETELGPLLEVASPYSRLQRELENSREQLGWLAVNVFRPTEQLREEVEQLDERLEAVESALQRLQARGRELGAMRLPETNDGLPRGGATRHAMELKSRLLSFKDDLQTVNATPLREICDEDREDLTQARTRLEELLEPLEGGLILVEKKLVDPLLELLRGSEAGGPIDLAVLEKMYALLEEGLAGFDMSRLAEVSSILGELRHRNALLLKERICQDLGFVRTTFLQPSFAHIAAEDPRSMHTAQYFYLKEFAEEAERSQQLLEAAHELWQELEGAQSTRIRGLRFSANNLNKIADRVLLERRAVPSGPGWTELGKFLEELKDRLVPRLRMICTLPGVRFDDKDQLTRYATEVSEACSMLLAQRQTAHSLVREMDRAEEEGADREPRRHYEDIILRVTCEDMAIKLRRISCTLIELIPYVGAMVGSIRMRTSLSFHQQREGEKPKGRRRPPYRRPAGRRAESGVTGWPALER